MCGDLTKYGYVTHGYFAYLKVKQTNVMVVCISISIYVCTCSLKKAMEMTGKARKTMTTTDDHFTPHVA